MFQKDLAQRNFHTISKQRRQENKPLIYQYVELLCHCFANRLCWILPNPHIFRKSFFHY